MLPKNSFLFPVLAVALATSARAAQLVELDELQAGDIETGDRFGASVALDGGRILIGAPGESSLGEGAGAAYVFERQGDGTWAELQKLLPSDGGLFDAFGYALALEGDRALIGAPGAPGIAGSDVGAAYVFERAGDGTWVEVDRLVSTSGGPIFGDFGLTVALSGERALIGDHSNGAHGQFAGAAHVFERDAGGDWVEVQELQPSDGGPDTIFGEQVALDGDRALVTSLWKGKATVFERQPSGTWLEVAELDPAGTGINAIALQGDRVLVDSAGNTVEVFERQPTGAWQSVALLRGPIPAGSAFGSALALDGERALVGANFDDAMGVEAGAAYVFERQASGEWTQLAKLLPYTGSDGDSFGFSVALQGDRALCGGLFDHYPVWNAGSASLFDLDPFTSPSGALSLSAGGSQPLWIDAGAIHHSGELYFVLGSLAGTAPGMPVGGPFVLPLNQDPYFLYTLHHPNSPVLASSFGALSSAGSAQASLNLPPGTNPSLAGLTAHHAFVTLHAASMSVTFASNPVATALLP